MWQIKHSKLIRFWYKAIVYILQLFVCWTSLCIPLMLATFDNAFQNPLSGAYNAVSRFEHSWQNHPEMSWCISGYLFSFDVITLDQSKRSAGIVANQLAMIGPVFVRPAVKLRHPISLIKTTTGNYYLRDSNTLHNFSYTSIYNESYLIVIEENGKYWEDQKNNFLSN